MTDTEQAHIFAGTCLIAGFVLIIVASVWFWGPMALMVGGAVLFLIGFFRAGVIESQRKKRQS